MCVRVNPLSVDSTLPGKGREREGAEAERGARVQSGRMGAPKRGEEAPEKPMPRSHHQSPAEDGEGNIRGLLIYTTALWIL